MKYSTTYNFDVLHYARAIFTDTEMDNLGRALPIDAQRDTGTYVCDS